MFGKKKGGDSNTAMLSGAVTIAEKTQKNESLCKSLPLRTRIKCWLACFVTGMVVSFLSGSMVRKLATTNDPNGAVIKFIIFYSIGTACALSSSLFLWGPAK